MNVCGLCTEQKLLISLLFCDAQAGKLTASGDTAAGCLKPKKERVCTHIFIAIQ